MEKLAIDGGKKIFGDGFGFELWPPVYPETGDQLRELYMSHKWSFYGAYETKFAPAFAAYHDARYGVFMANGTVTLECALTALGVKPGDEVIVPAWTWLATGTAVCYVGATPVFVDGEADTFCMDPAAFEAAITPRTTAVIPVHLFGSFADMEKICAIAKKHHIAVIEDCAHVHGGKWAGKGIGSFGDVGSFSFQQSKIMNSGEGGACITDNPELFEKISRLKHIGYMPGNKQGQASAPPPEGLLCHNYRATEFQALILQAQLDRLAADSAKRARAADCLRRRFEAIPGVKVQAPGRLATMQAYYVYGVTIDPAVLKPGKTKKDVVAALQAEGVPEVFEGWGAPAYRQRLWNVPSDRYRVASAKTVEEIIDRKIILFAIQWLMSDVATLDKLGAAMTKVMTAYRR